MDLIPPALIVAHYFANEQAEIDARQSALEIAEQKLEEYIEEHTGENGLLADATNDSGNVTKTTINARLKELTPNLMRHNGTQDSDEEHDALEHCLSLIETKSKADKALKEAQLALDEQVLARYATLTETEIKQLVIDDKWLTTIRAAIIGEVQRLTQNLTERVKELEERYAQPLPELERQAAVCSARVKEHLKKIGMIGHKEVTIESLFTGKVRLPGFSGAWETVKMGQIGSIYGGLSGKNKSDFEGGNARYVTFLGVLENVTLDVRHTERVHVRNGESQNSVIEGDLLFNASSETPGDLAIGAVMGEQLENLYLNSFCFGFRIHNKNKYMPLFFAYYFRGSVGRTIMNALAQGATRYNMSKSQFRDLELSIPSGEEQRAIAAVLSDIDAEIAALEQRRDKTITIKQGMMQQLLTGRVRLSESRIIADDTDNAD